MSPNQQMILDKVSEAIMSDETLGPLRKRVIVRRLERRPAIQDLVMDKVISGAYIAGIIVPAELAAEEPIASVDWEALAEFIKEILPLIMQIVSLFL